MKKILTCILLACAIGLTAKGISAHDIHSLLLGGICIGVYNAIINEKEE
jgi:hypothetical protein